jgi:hypothetical protein
MTKHCFMNTFLKIPTGRQTAWKFAACLIGLVLLAGCAKTKVTDQQRLVYERLPRPNHIWIYDFGATAASVPPESALAGQANVTSFVPTSEETMVAQELGSLIATKLVESIREMGLPAEHGMPGVAMAVNDIAIHGYFVSIEQGSAAARMTVGFGAGGSELSTVVEGFQMTASGPRRLGSASLGSKSGKTPGAGVGAAGWAITGSPVGLIVGGGLKVYSEASGSAKVEGRAKQTASEIADKLKARFQEEGWIQ